MKKKGQRLAYPRLKIEGKMITDYDLCLGELSIVGNNVKDGRRVDKASDLSSVFVARVRIIVEVELGVGT
jgi:hypothetical protein